MLFPNLGRGRWATDIGVGGPDHHMLDQEGAAKQLPFHESITVVMDELNWVSAAEFAIICDVISSTKVPKGHETVLDSLDRLAERSGFELMEGSGHYAKATQALHEGMVEADDDSDSTVTVYEDTDNGGALGPGGALS